MKIQYFVFVLFLSPCFSYAQKVDSLVKKLDSLDKKTDSVGAQKNITAPQAYNEQTKITASTYAILLWSDYKQQLSAPFHITGRGWLHVGAFAAVTGGLMLLDEPIQQRTVRFTNNKQTVSDISRAITNTGGVYEVGVLGALGAYGFIAKNEKIKTTTFLASQAYLTSTLVSQLVKVLAGRQRPSYYRDDRVEAEPSFKGPFKNMGRDVNGKKLNGSFPSGHTTLAFSAATVYAMEYRDKPLVPILSYTAASLIGLSRITENKHWFTDVFVGAALGHLCGRQVVNNYHRYAKIQREKAQKNTLSFNLGYYQGRMLPGLRYSLN